MRLPRAHWIRQTCCLIALALGAAPRAAGDLLPAQVLVVYNAASADAITLKDAYLALHPDIPAANVCALNDTTLLVPNFDISYANFVTRVRNPIRNFINAVGGPTPQSIAAIVLIRPFPHRFQDTDNPSVGDNPFNASDEFNGGDATYASVDSELTLLFQDINSNEAGARMDSKSDNMIDNPYHTQSAGIDTFSRANITVQKIWDNRSNFCWVNPNSTGSQLMTPGDMYLVCRLDGSSFPNTQAALQRSRNLVFNRAKVRVLLDEYNLAVAPDLDDDPLFAVNDPFNAGDDYESTRNRLLMAGWDVRYDASSNFISSAEETMPLALYASYGENHSVNGGGESPPGTAIYIDGFNFAPGAIFNTIESFNGRNLNGITGGGQEQIADFIAAGGTFGVASVFEPFSFTIPDNDYIAQNFLINGLTWGEAAWSAIPALSWTHIVIGDPLARAAVVNDPGLPQGDLNGDGQVDGDDIPWFVLLSGGGFSQYRTAFPALDPYARGDFNGDWQHTTADAPAFVNALLTP